MPLHLTRKQSMWLGLSLLALFFLASGATIYRRNQIRVPTASNILTKESVEGISIPISSNMLPVTTPSMGGLGFVLNDFHRSLVRDGKTIWEIRGVRGQYDALQNKAQIDKPDLTVVRDNGDTVKLTADKSDLILSGTQLISADLFDHVVAIYKGNTIIRTSRATYSEKDGRVDIPVPVELDSPMFSIKGKKLVALIDSQQIYITGGVVSTVNPKRKH